MIENSTLCWNSVGERMKKKLGGRKTVEEFEKNDHADFSLSAVETMVAELESVIADGGEYVEAVQIVKDLHEKDAVLHVNVQWNIHLFPSVYLAIHLTSDAEGGLRLCVPVFCEDLRWWVCSAAHASMLERGEEYTSDDFPKCMKLDPLITRNKIFILQSDADLSIAINAVKLAISNTATIRKFCTTLDKLMVADMANVSKRLHWLNEELRNAYDRVSALHKKTGALWDVVCAD